MNSRGNRGTSTRLQFQNKLELEQTDRAGQPGLSPGLASYLHRVDPNGYFLDCKFLIFKWGLKTSLASTMGLWEGSLQRALGQRIIYDNMVFNYHCIFSLWSQERSRKDAIKRFLQTLPFLPFRSSLEGLGEGVRQRAGFLGLDVSWSMAGVCPGSWP